MNTTMTVAELFAKKFNAIALQVSFDPNWKNTTGYLNGAVSADLGLKVEQWAKTIDDFDRRVIIGNFGPEGNIVAEEEAGVLSSTNNIGSSLSVEGLEWLTASLRI